MLHTCTCCYLGTSIEYTYMYMYMYTAHVHVHHTSELEPQVIRSTTMGCQAVTVKTKASHLCCMHSQSPQHS